MSEIDKLVADLERGGRGVGKRVQGRGRPVVDEMANQAQQLALATWTTYGHGMAGAAGTIRGRMARGEDEPRGYVIADGEGAFQSEYGTTTHAPTPVLGAVTDQFEGAWAGAVEDAGADLL